MRQLTLLLLILFSSAQAQDTGGYTVVKEKSELLGGKVFSEVGIDWWLWALTSPKAADPVADNTGKNCYINQHGNVFYLAGTYENGAPINRTCIISSQKTIFFPIINYQSNSGTYTSCQQNLKAMSKSIDKVTDQSVSINSQRVQGYMRGLTKKCVYLKDYKVWMGVDGYWMAIKFKPGKYSLSFKASFDNFKQNVTYNLEIR